jgi:hypothetical protein
MTEKKTIYRKNKQGDRLPHKEWLSPLAKQAALRSREEHKRTGEKVGLIKRLKKMKVTLPQVGRPE